MYIVDSVYTINFWGTKLKRNYVCSTRKKGLNTTVLDTRHRDGGTFVSLTHLPPFIRKEGSDIHSW
jgi:hypothetical protein